MYKYIFVHQHLYGAEAKQIVRNLSFLFALFMLNILTMIEKIDKLCTEKEKDILSV